MHLLYLDDSGSVGNASDGHVVLAGVSVPERAPHWLSEDLERLAEKIWPDNPRGIEFRGSDIFSGRKHWRGQETSVRMEAYEEALGLLAKHRDVRLFGAVIHKAAASPRDAIEFAFEHVCNRFDRMLGRLHKSGNTQRGIIILDESANETALQRLSHDFRHIGHSWGRLHNLAEVPLFVNSRATRMIQYADLVAYALRKYYEQGISRYFDLISRSFDAEGGVSHGLVHYIPQHEACVCMACRLR